MTITSQVSSSTEDAEERISNGYVYLNSTDLELVTDGSNLQIVGLRFNGLNIPPGAIVTNAYIEFQVDEVQSEQTSLNIFAQAADSATGFTNSAYNISSRGKTLSQVNWNNIPTWTPIGSKQTTPDLSSIIQEVVNRPGWIENNSLVIIITGSGHRTAEAYDGSTTGAPRLVVTYTTGSTTPVPSPTATFTPSYTATNTATSTPTPSQTPTHTATNTATNTTTNTATSTPTPSQTPTFTATFTPTNTATDTATSTPTPSHTPINTAVFTPSTPH